MIYFELHLIESFNKIFLSFVRSPLTGLRTKKTIHSLPFWVIMKLYIDSA